MSFAFAPPVTPVPGTACTVIDAARCWRIARDAGDPMQPALFVRLEAWGCGVLAPVLDGLLALFEAGFRRSFRSGRPLDAGLTSDEHLLLDLLEDEDSVSRTGLFHPDLVAAMRVALRSSRIMLRSVIWREIDAPSLSAPAPIL
jgi:hypothetical protein